jgi:hypothetical protein
LVLSPGSSPVLVAEAPGGGAQLWHRLGVQLETLAARLDVPVAVARVIFDQLAAEPLNGPFERAGRRFSGIQRDGIPFEWSVSAGASPGGLRFLVDHGIPGTSMTTRTRRSLRVLARLLGQLGVRGGLAAEYESLLRRLLPPGPVLDQLLMGMWIGVGIDARGRVGFKVYVNQQVGSHAARYLHLATCLVHLQRPGALQRLDAFTRAAGDLVVPGGIAVELRGSAIGRVKLYMRSRSGNPSFFARAAERLGCLGAAERLDVYHAVMSGRAGYDPRAVMLSVEFPPDAESPSFKIEVNCWRVFGSDCEAHARTLELIARLTLDDTEYRALVDTCAPDLSARAVERFTWLGTALRGHEQRVNVYLHPGRL